MYARLQSVSSFAGAYVSPCAGGLAGGNEPWCLPILYKSRHRTTFMVLQPKFYRGCYKIIWLNSFHSPSQRNNGDLGLPLMLYNRGRFTPTAE